MKATVALVMLTMVLFSGCSGDDDAATNRGAERPAGAADEPGSPADLERAQALLDAGDIPGAIEPLRRAVRISPARAAIPVTEIDFLLTQAEAASRPETAEARIAEMKDAPFEAFVGRGELPRIPYFHDPRIDTYFRKQVMAKRGEAREIRERIRGR
jgi:hypothetical protein